MDRGSLAGYSPEGRKESGHDWLLLCPQGPLRSRDFVLSVPEWPQKPPTAGKSLSEETGARRKSQVPKLPVGTGGT